MWLAATLGKPYSLNLSLPSVSTKTLDGWKVAKKVVLNIVKSVEGLPIQYVLHPLSTLNLTFLKIQDNSSLKDPGIFHTHVNNHNDYIPWYFRGLSHSSRAVTSGPWVVARWVCWRWGGPRPGSAVTGWCIPPACTREAPSPGNTLHPLSQMPARQKDVIRWGLEWWGLEWWWWWWWWW